jgi:dTDP-L-rhamnose 4-epimerase
MKVVISGGAGFIGSHLARSLVRVGHTVTVLDILSEQVHGERPDESPLYAAVRSCAEVVRGDVRDPEAWRTALHDAGCVVHLAAETGTGQSMYEITKYADVNVKGTAVLLDLLMGGSHSIRKVVVASSRAIYGEGAYRCSTHGTVYPVSRSSIDLAAGDFSVKCPHCRQAVSSIPTREDAAIHPISIYGMTKHDQERMVLTICASAGIPATALRYQNVYGPGQSLKNPYTGILSIFSTRILNGNGIEIYEDGEESRDFVYIDDVVEATIVAIERDEAAGMAINVGSGVSTSVYEVAESLREHYGRDVPLTKSGHYRVGDIRHNTADLTLARRVLGFEPRVSFKEGIAHFTRWVGAQEVDHDRYEESVVELRQKGLYK